jgi:hypothetical protein
MAWRRGAPHRPRLHADVDGGEPRRGACSRDDRGRRRSGHHRVRHRACVRPRRERARPQRAAARPRSPRLWRTRQRADRDERGHDANRRPVDSGRSREGDSDRLRGEPRRAGRAGDRPLPHPCTRSTDAVANVRARVGPARRRRPRPARGAGKCQPPPVGRGTRARPCYGRPGRAQPLRRPGTPRRSRRPLRRERDRRDRPLSARGTAPGGRRRS